MKKIPVILSTIITAFFITSSLANAQSANDFNNIFLSIGNTLFRFEGPVGILNDARFNGETMTFTMPQDLAATFQTETDRDMSVEPVRFGTVSCDSGNNRITINTAGADSPVLITVSAKVGACSAPGKTFLNAFEEFRSSPATQRVVKEIIIPISITVTSISAGTLIVNASVGSASFAFNFTQLLQQLGLIRFYVLGLLRFRRKRPWGRVLERFSGHPISGALVQIYEAEFKKIKDAQLTDAEGRFSAFMTPGKYYIKVSKTGFETQEAGSINILNPDTALDLEINISPLTAGLNLSYIQRLNILHLIKRILDAINPYLLIFGTLIGFGSLIIIPTTLNYAGFIIYLCLDILKIYFAAAYVKPFGKVLDASSGGTLPLAVVRIFEAGHQLLLSTKVTDAEGHFNFLLTEGHYYLTCAKAGYAPYRSETITLEKSGIATLNIVLKRA